MLTFFTSHVGIISLGSSTHCTEWLIVNPNIRVNPVVGVNLNTSSNKANSLHSHDVGCGGPVAASSLFA